MNRRYRLRIAGLLLTPLALAPLLRAQEPAGSDPLNIEVLMPRSSVDHAGPAAAAPAGDRIAYSRADAEGYLDLYSSRPDGTDESCLTCLLRELRKRHAGAPAWHPSGDWVVFQLEKPFEEAGRPNPFQEVPGRNLGADLWYVSADGRRYGQLTRRAERGGRVLAPCLSYEGRRLAWSEKVAGSGGAWGTWVIRVADFAVQRGIPRIGKVETYEPGPGPFYETYAFTPDDRGVIFASNPSPGAPESGMDLFVLRLDGGEVERLTDSPESWDRFAAASPDGRLVAWSSSEGLEPAGRELGRADRRAATIPLDLWLMDLDSGRRRRLTSFNDPLDPTYAGRQRLGPSAWSRSGDRLWVLATPLAEPTAAELLTLDLVGIVR